MYLGYEKTDLSPGARFLRDLFIGIAAILGIVMAGWRNFALDRQSKAATKQAEIGNRQAQHDRDRIAGEQFSGAAKLLAQKDAKNKPAIDARIGGIYSLQTLANNRIEEYGAQVVKTLISYIKQNAQLTAQPPLKENKTLQEAHALGEDVKTAFNVLRQLLAAREKDSAEWNKPSDGIKLSDQDLSFSGQDFSWLDLSASQVGGLNRYIWNQSNLQNARLLEADLQNANLWAAELQGTDLSDAHLQGAELSVANLQGAHLSGAQLQGAHLSEADMRGAHLSRADLRDAELPGADLDGADLSGADLHSADLSEASLQGANLSKAKLHDADLSRADLQGADLSEADLQGADLSEADLQGADLSEANLNDKTTLPTNLPGKIWHSGQSELSKTASLLPDAEWDLTPFLRSGYALAGILDNFALPYGIAPTKNESVMRAKKLRIAVRNLDKKKLPDDFSQFWRNWLAKIESDGSHPNDALWSG